jgi:hypothetical protein
MALTSSSRRYNIALGATVIAASALAATAFGRSCTRPPSGPEAAVRSVLAAAATGDRQAVFDRLSPTTQERLSAQVQRATDLVGGGVRYTVLDLISIGSARDPAAELTVTEQYGDRAIVEVVYQSGARTRVVTVRVNGTWRIDLPQYGDEPPAPR